MWGTIGKIFGGGLVESLERVALEAIETDKESAEAKAIMIKTLDPNGKMRRDLSRFASIAYGFYLFCTTIMIFMVSFELGNASGAEKAAELMTELFVPITTSWGAIVGASFGVNGINSAKGK